MDIFNEDIQKVLLSALLGALIGLEREWSGKAAGFRTMMLVSVGGTLFTLVSHHMALLDIRHASDVTRIASNIVTGIGFIGAGIIFRNQQSIHGVTTAAAVWTAGAIGMSVGIGDYQVAVETTAIVLIILVILHFIEKRFESKYMIRDYVIRQEYTTDAALLKPTDFFDKNYKIRKVKTEKSEGMVVLTWTVRATQEKHDLVVAQLVRDTRVTQLHY
ncbi:MgtC/SapB family protein [Polluticoccus soli]|uniref:MgtC/SapB family protein n=1 Tax=Polluticoccus soli TaxID=3034150 RepID=UPI0023E0D6EE|nr:MgtC/SapB family protein [Flavipsychrobacter sp. JY13-12]